MDWQQILISIEISENNSSESTTYRQKEDIKILRLIRERTFSFAVGYHNILDELLVEQALNNSVNFDRELEFPFIKRSENLDNVIFENDDHCKKMSICLNIKSNKKNNIKEKTEFILSPSILDREKLYFAQSDYTKISFFPWIISPLALSKIILKDWESFLIKNKKQVTGINFPNDICITDRAIKHKFDFEGTIKRETTFVRNGQILNFACNFINAEGDLSLLNGHGGIEDVFFSDLYLESVKVGNWPMDKFYFVEDVHNLKNDLFLVTFTSLFGRHIELININRRRLFDDYKWLDERGRGNFPWNVPYLQIFNTSCHERRG
ncbi:hypothetical protein [Bacillus cereus]|uniref:hypothetical protein n=1 Tax=Bacillus cereus TaxID=1396 RepID=UPI00187917D6|nr:hypothetical protein [Bacillus cereus]MBE7099147.1 hypothetical protein [Bacillus cereus]